MGSSVTFNTPGQPLPTNGGDWKPSSVPNTVSFAFQGVPPPSMQYIQRDDVIVVSAQTNITGGDTITVTARLLLPVNVQPGQPSDDPSGQVPRTSAPGSGFIDVIQKTIALPTPGTLVNVAIQLAEGYLLSVAVASQNATQFSQTYVGVYIGRGAPGTSIPVPAQLLIADYPTNIIPVGWPGVPLRQTGSGLGVLSNYFPGTVAATTGLTYIVPAGQRVRVHSIYVNLSTNATVGNRFVYIDLQDASGNHECKQAFNVTQAASTNCWYTAALGAQYVTDITNLLMMSMPLPDISIPAGGKINLFVNGAVVGDNIVVPNISLETWVQ